MNPLEFKIACEGALRPRVYIAGPLTGDAREENCRRAIAAGEAVSYHGASPYIPHLMVGWEKYHEHDYEFWMRECFVWLRQCHSLIRLAGKSSGADREVAFAKELGIPVYEGVDAWVRSREGRS